MNHKLLTVCHIWDYKAASAKDLHTELLRREDVRSQQVICEFRSNDKAAPPHTSAFRTITSSAPKSGLLPRIWRALTRRLARAQYEGFVLRHLPRGPEAVLNAHFGTTGWWCSRLAERQGLPLVVTFYGVDVSEMVREKRWQRRYQELFQRACRLVVLCQQAKDRLVALGCPSDKVRIWNHPLDLDAYEYRPRQPGPQVRLIIGARFVEKKGYPYLLNACSKLIRAGRDLTLTAVGYGTDGGEIQQLANRLELGSRFRLINTAGTADFDAFYSQILHEHDIFVLPSTTARSGDDEGGPALSLVLAQAAGLPVICTPFAGSEITVCDGETGLFCRQDDADSLAERIAYLADRPELWDRLGSAANRLVRNQFDFAHQVDEMIAIYREAAGNAVAPALLSSGVERS